MINKINILKEILSSLSIKLINISVVKNKNNHIRYVFFKRLNTFSQSRSVFAYKEVLSGYVLVLDYRTVNMTLQIYSRRHMNQEMNRLARNLFKVLIALCEYNPKEKGSKTKLTLNANSTKAS